MFSHIFETINIGLVVLDPDLRVTHWNRWIATHSGISAEKIIGKPLFDYFPNLNTPRFSRNCKSVFTFGNFCFFPHKLHRYLFPMSPVGSFYSHFEYMQQNCTMGPIRGDDNNIHHLFISVEDATETAFIEEKLVNLCHNDPLTGIYNRRYLEDKLQETILACEKYNYPLSVIMIDIDFFKEINDQYGHQHGDLVLKEIAGHIRVNIRETDYLARYGGEEFCCVLVDTPFEAAIAIAEKLRKLVSKFHITIKDVTIKRTISLGVASYEENFQDADTLINNADNALYQAKNSGRNKVMAVDGLTLT